MLDFVHIVCWI